MAGRYPQQHVGAASWRRSPASSVYIRRMVEVNTAASSSAGDFTTTLVGRPPGPVRWGAVEGAAHADPHPDPLDGGRPGTSKPVAAGQPGRRDVVDRCRDAHDCPSPARAPCTSGPERTPRWISSRRTLRTRLANTMAAAGGGGGGRPDRPDRPPCGPGSSSRMARRSPASSRLASTSARRPGAGSRTSVRITHPSRPAAPSGTARARLAAQALLDVTALAAPEQDGPVGRGREVVGEVFTPRPRPPPDGGEEILPQALAGPVEAPLGGRLGDPELDGDVLVGQVVDVAEHHHLAELRGRERGPP